jgi:hypothetical protein
MVVTDVSVEILACTEDHGMDSGSIDFYWAKQRYARKDSHADFILVRIKCMNVQVGIY